MDSIRELILKRLRDLHISLNDASVLMGRNVTYLQQYIGRRVPKSLREEDRRRLAQILQLNEDDLRNERTETSDQRQAPVSSARQKILETAPPLRIMAAPDMPIFGIMERGDSFVLTRMPVDHGIRPDTLAGVDGAYGVFVHGDAMAPELEHGSTVYMHPHLPPRIGDTCAFRCELDGDTQLTFGKLIETTARTWKMRQHAAKKDIELSKSKWLAHKVVFKLYP